MLSRPVGVNRDTAVCHACVRMMLSGCQGLDGMHCLLGSLPAAAPPPTLVPPAHPTTSADAPLGVLSECARLLHVSGNGLLCENPSASKWAGGRCAVYATPPQEATSTSSCAYYFEVSQLELASEGGGEAADGSPRQFGGGAYASVPGASPSSVVPSGILRVGFATRLLPRSPSALMTNPLATEAWAWCALACCATTRRSAHSATAGASESILHGNRGEIT